MITSRYIQVQGIKIFVETNNGPREKGVMVCFGSAGRESRQYHAMMEYLANRMEVVCFDMPGHGKSWPLLDNRCIEEYHGYCDFIINTLKELRIENPICVGCALGGYVVFYLAQRIPVRAIVSMAGTDYSPHVDASVSDNLDHPYASVQHTHIDFTDSLIGSAATEEDREFILWGVMTEIGKVKRADYGGVYNGFDVRADMPLVTCPTLLLRGAEDWTVRNEAFHPMVARLVNASPLQLTILDGIAHYNPQEAPALVCDTILDFLRKAECSHSEM